MGAQGNRGSRASLRFAMLRCGGSRVKMRFAIVLSFLVAMLESPAHARPSDAAQVRQTFARFIAALAARDADAGLPLLSTASLTEWQRDRELALHGTRDEVASQSPGRRLIVMALRHHAPKFLRREGSPRELAGYALGAGMADRDSLAAIEVGDVAVKGDRAGGQLFASGLPSGFRADFVREDGAWKLDLGSSIEAAGRVVTRAAKAGDASEDSVIAGLLMVSSGERPTSRIWEPMARGSAVDSAQ
jgi:hypothetical protein